MKITAFSVIMKVFQSRKWFMQGSIYRVLRHILLNHDMNSLYDGIIPNCHYEEFEF